MVNNSLDQAALVNILPGLVQGNQSRVSKWLILRSDDQDRLNRPGIVGGPNS
jgi:hypothetical protein